MISVLIPVYNVDQYLQSCIDSLVAQTFKDIEFIFVNDASTDNSLEILEMNQEKYPDLIRIIDSKEHINLGGARNKGLKAARGEYVGFVDSDDMIAPNMYEELFNTITKNVADVAFVMYSYIDNKTDYQNALSKDLHTPGIVWNERLLKMEGRLLNDSDRNDLHIFPIGGIWSGLWKKEVIVDNDVWWIKPKYEDNYWVGLIYCYISKVSFVQKVCYFYRYNPDSITHKRNQKYTLDRIIVEKSLLNEAKKRKLYDRFYLSWEYIYIRRYAINTFYMLINNWDIIPYEVLFDISADLNKEFPLWFQNKYFEDEFRLIKKIFYIA